jgi:hypothetical protein
VNADDEIRTDPKPPDVVLDRDRVPQLIGAAMLAADNDDDDLRRDLILDEFTWILDGWDDHGQATVEVIARRDGRLLGSVRLHWSRLLP